LRSNAGDSGGKKLLLDYHHPARPHQSIGWHAQSCSIDIYDISLDLVCPGPVRSSSRGICRSPHNDCEASILPDWLSQMFVCFRRHRIFIPISFSPGGTSALYDYLCLHPQIRPGIMIDGLADIKEPHFFASTRYDRLGMGVYEQFLAPQIENSDVHVC
jgi:hypothetical protein